MAKNKKIIIAVAIITIVVAISIWFLVKSGEEPVACAMDAKLCPDGSYVGRIPPKCDFAVCPETKTIKLFYYNYELDRDESGS